MDTTLTALEREFLRQVHAADQRKVLLARLSAFGLLDEFRKIEADCFVVSPVI